MSYELVVEPSAARDVAEADTYYSEHGRGDDFMAAIDHAFGRISELPLMYPVAYGVVRRALLHRFTYSVFFILEADRAVILAVQHHRRDPAARPQPRGSAQSFGAPLIERASGMTVRIASSISREWAPPGCAKALGVKPSATRMSMLGFTSSAISASRPLAAT
jgi:hypothetical protein